MKIVLYIQYATYYHTEAARRLVPEIKAKVGNQELLAGEGPHCIWTQRKAINFISK